MKITIDVECSPEEVRAFFGPPDGRPPQQAFVAEAEERRKRAFDGMDGDALLKTRRPPGAAAFEKMQQAFWLAMDSRKGKGDGGCAHGD